MASRAIRKTTLTLGLVNAPVAIRKMQDAPAKEFSLTMGSIDGNKVSQRYLDETTGAVYTPGEVLKGVYDDPTNGIGFHPVSKEAMEAIDSACEIDGLVIEGFIPAEELPVNRVETTYFLAPEGGTASSKSLALIRAAMNAEGAVGIGKCTLSKRQRPFAIYVAGDAIVLALLTFTADCAAREEEAQNALTGVEVEDKILGMARTLVQSMTGAATLNDYADDSLPQREALILAASNGETIEVPEAAVAAAPAVDLEAALLASIGAAAPKVEAPAKKKPAAKAA